MRLLVATLGFLLGVAAGIALLLANPLAWKSGLPPLATDGQPARAWRWEQFRGLERGPADLLGLRPAAVPADPALAHLRVGIVVLPAGGGVPAALAVKASVLSDANSLWRARLGTNDYWNIFWPGEGSAFATGYSNYWLLLRDGLIDVLRSRDGPARPDPYAVSARSPDGGLPRVTGASGRYAGFTGDLREFLYPAAPGSPREGRDWAIVLKVAPAPVASP